MTNELTHEKFQELVRPFLEPVLAEEAALRAALLDTRLDAMPEGERPNGDELADLDSRLAGAMALDRVVVVERTDPPVVHVRSLDARDARELLEKLWPRIAGEWQAHRAPVVAARLTLDDERARDDQDGRRARDPEAVSRLATAVRAPLDELLTATGDGDGATARAVDWLKAWGDADAEALLAKRYGARMADPVDRPLLLARFVARRLWPAVRERLVEESTPAVVTQLITDTQRARHAQVTLPFDGVSEVELRKGKVVVGRLVPTIDPRALSCDPRALQSLTTQRLLRWLVGTGHRQRFVEQRPEPSQIVVERGWTGLAFQLGMKGKKAATEVRESVCVLEEFRLPASPTLDAAHNYTRLLTVEHVKEARGQRTGELTLALLGPLRPGYVVDQLKDHRIAEDKWLVPVPLPEKLPAMIGREADYGSQAALQLLTMQALRKAAVELCQTEAVTLDKRAWERLADDAGLPRRMLAGVLDAWETGVGRTPGPKFLVRRGTDRFDLAPDFTKEREHILAAGEKQLGGRAARKAYRRKRK